MCVCPSVRPSVCLLSGLSGCLTVFPSIRPSALSVSLSVCMYVCLSLSATLCKTHVMKNNFHGILRTGLTSHWEQLETFGHGQDHHLDTGFFSFWANSCRSAMWLEVFFYCLCFLFCYFWFVLVLFGLFGGRRRGRWVIALAFKMQVIDRMADGNSTSNKPLQRASQCELMPLMPPPHTTTPSSHLHPPTTHP